MAKAELAQIEGEQASREVAFEDHKDAFAKFAYYNVLADVILAMRPISSCW